VSDDREQLSPANGASTVSAVSTLSLDEAAGLLGLSAKRVHQLIGDGELVAVREDGGNRRIPADFVQDGVVVKGLPAVITLLRDAHYRDDEIVEWLYRAEDSLPGTPIQALRENRGREVKRRAQVAGF
jgi:excisionase family DNA binding protein